MSESVDLTPAPPVAPPSPPQISVNDKHVVAAYANFARVSGTPEELILDFGLNSNVPGAAEDAIHTEQRVVVNYYTAKRLFQVLAMTVQRHEAAFGTIEVNVDRRVGGHGMA